MIKEIDQWSAAQIQSGQVIVELASGVKELVENAIDANASMITVKIHNYGLDGLSVTDNGSGIAQEDFALVAKNHATSKIKSMQDLESVRTLGFRGEALASLCAVAKMQITTRTAADEMGTEISFNQSGNVVSTKNTTRSVGTTVAISDFFYTLPVRRKDLERNYKRKYTELLRVLQSYAVIWTGTMLVDHISKDGKKSNALRAQGASIIDRVSLVFGSKTSASLMKVEEASDYLQLSGCISKPQPLGKSQQRYNTQLLYVNGRPTDQKMITRAITELFREFEPHSFPFVVLNIIISPDQLDVNLSPDKRDIRFHSELQVIEEIKMILQAKFADDNQYLARRATQRDTITMPKTTTLSRFLGAGKILEQKKRSKMAESSEEDVDMESDKEMDDSDEAPAKVPKRDVKPARKQFIGANFAFGGEEKAKSTSPGMESSHVSPSELTPAVNTSNSENLVDKVGLFVTARELEIAQSRDRRSRSSPLELEESGEEMSLELETAEADDSTLQELEESTKETSESQTSLHVARAPEAINERPQALPKGAMHAHSEEGSVESDSTETTSAQMQATPAASDLTITGSSSIDQENVNLEEPVANKGKLLNTHISLPTSIEEIRHAMENAAKQDPPKVRNLAIDGEEAEVKLDLKIRKEDFKKMNIIGQFNLGFILVSRRKDNREELFIIDQHASDEIYNFEKLQNTTVMRRQPLVSPRQLELSAVEELTLINNIDVIEKNGFSIDIKPERESGKKCFVSALPYSKGTVFTDADINELIYKISDQPNDKNIKCSRLRAMLAMRACRMSIMIGNPLSEKAMRKVVDNLGTLNKPWNCPHGRPTIRHITTLC